MPRPRSQKNRRLALAAFSALAAVSALSWALLPLAPLWGAEHYQWAGWPWLVLLGLTGLFAGAFAARRKVAAAAGRVRVPKLPCWLSIPALYGVLSLLKEERYTGDWIPYGFRVPMGPDWLFWRDIYWLAPLSHLIHYAMWALVDPFVNGQFLQWTQVIMVAWGTVLLVMVRLMGRELFGPGRLGWLFTLLYVSSGMVFFSTGRIESYPISMGILAIALFLGLRAIRLGRGAPWCALALGAAAMAHPQNIIFVPSFIVVMWACRDEGSLGRQMLKSIGMLLVFPALVVLFARLNDISGGSEEMAAGSFDSVILPASMVFTTYRVEYLASVALRMVPLLPALLVGIIIWRKQLPMTDAAGWFLGFNAVAGFCYALFIWNKARMEVDWDLISPSLVPMSLALWYAVIKVIPPGERWRLGLCIVALQLPHTILWVAWNKTPDPEQAAQIEMLTEHISGVRTGILPRDEQPPRRP